MKNTTFFTILSLAFFSFLFSKGYSQGNLTQAQFNQLQYVSGKIFTWSENYGSSPNGYRALFYHLCPTGRLRIQTVTHSDYVYGSTQISWQDGQWGYYIEGGDIYFKAYYGNTVETFYMSYSEYFGYYLKCFSHKGRDLYFNQRNTLCR